MLLMAWERISRFLFGEAPADPVALPYQQRSADAAKGAGYQREGVNAHFRFMHDANTRRLASFRQNAKHADGVRWLATLDGNGCPICAALDGLAWDFDGKPINGHTINFRAPPLYGGCRCVMTLIPKSLDSILGMTGLDAKLAAGSRRASAQGPVAGDMTMQTWLREQDVTLVRRVLGPGRAYLYFSNKADLIDFIDSVSCLLPLQQVLERVESRWRLGR